MTAPSSAPTSGLAGIPGADALARTPGAGAFASGTASSELTSALEPTRIPLAVTVEGGSTPVVLAAIVTFFAATVLAVLVTYRFVEGYRRTRARPILLLAVGMFLLAPAPMFVRLLAGNLEAVPLAAQLLLTTLSELCGLLVILYVVYTT
ncbi:DUF7521 family protein [Natronorubrum sp. FCH18a]|uniref:DUF7521 family protein n=1 Tax=Natronorubrum sp. FCH18a TaxID=3447018 RepID=UPI003F5101C0